MLEIERSRRIWYVTKIAKIQRLFWFITDRIELHTLSTNEKWAQIPTSRISPNMVWFLSSYREKVRLIRRFLFWTRSNLMVN